MIKEKTVFILGAGASKDYGLPVGTELREQIIHTLGSGQSVSEISDLLGLRRSVILEFNSAFTACELPSIDSFLEKKNNPDFARLGKFLIAYHIGKRESPPLLRGKWLGILWDMMCQGAKTQDDLLQNRVTFIVFNYDRVLEEFLGKALVASYPESKNNNDILNAFPIVHPYGQIGLLGWQKNQENLASLAYNGSLMNWSLAKDCVSGIKVMHEGGSNMLGFSRAQDYIIAAEKVVFIGFGYHYENMSRLAIPSQDSPKKVLGSCFGITHQIPPRWGHKSGNGFGYDIDLRVASSLGIYLNELADIR